MSLAFCDLTFSRSCSQNKQCFGIDVISILKQECVWSKFTPEDPGEEIELRNIL